MSLETQTHLQQTTIPAEVAMPAAAPEHTTTTAPTPYESGDMPIPTPSMASATVEETVDHANDRAFVLHSNTLGSVLVNGESTPGFNAADTESPESPRMGGYRNEEHLRKAYRMRGPIIGRMIRQ